MVTSSSKRVSATPRLDPDMLIPSRLRGLILGLFISFQSHPRPIRLYIYIPSVNIISRCSHFRPNPFPHPHRDPFQFRSNSSAIFTRTPSPLSRPRGGAGGWRWSPRPSPSAWASSPSPPSHICPPAAPNDPLGDSPRRYSLRSQTRVAIPYCLFLLTKFKIT